MDNSLIGRSGAERSSLLPTVGQDAPPSCPTYIKVEDKGRYCSLHSPIWAKATEATFAQKREFVKQFRILEKSLIGKYEGWNAYTTLENHRVMRILTKVGAVPYYINLEHNTIWFYRRLKNG